MERKQEATRAEAERQEEAARVEADEIYRAFGRFVDELGRRTLEYVNAAMRNPEGFRDYITSQENALQSGSGSTRFME